MQKLIVLTILVLGACGGDDDGGGGGESDASGGGSEDAAANEYDATPEGDPDAQDDLDADPPVPVCAPGALLSGLAEPQAEGWSVETNVTSADTVIAEDGAVVIDTEGDTGAVTTDDALAPMFMFYRDVGVSTGFVLRLRVQVAAGSHNQYDAGAAIMASFTPPFGVGGDRSVMVYLEPDEVGWADDTDSEAVDLSGEFHDLELEASGTNLTLRVDGDTLLTRTDFAGSGQVAFGDHTNDAALDVDNTYNGHFTVEGIALDCLD